jgi:hypothetical protein
VRFRQSVVLKRVSDIFVRLIFLHGLPGVGKLTVASELTKLTGFRIFHNHLAVDLVESVFDFGSLPFVELREEVWLTVFTRAVAANLNGLIFTSRLIVQFEATLLKRPERLLNLPRVRFYLSS